VQTLTDLPAGGSLVVFAGFYSGTGWLAGQGVTASIPAQPNQGSTLIAPTITITENLVPLTATTSYGFKEKLGYANGARVWLPASSGAPTETVSDLNISNVGDNLGALGGLGLNEPLSFRARLSLERLGTGPAARRRWQRALFRPGIHLPVDQRRRRAGERAQVSGQGLHPPALHRAPATHDGPRRWPTVSCSCSMRATRSCSSARSHSSRCSRSCPRPISSFGKFVGPVDDLSIHPAGYAVALSTTPCKLQILKLGTQVADSDGAGRQHLFRPRHARRGCSRIRPAVSCSLDEILVLDSTPTYPQGCIAAFDFKGNPAYCFRPRLRR